MSSHFVEILDGNQNPIPPSMLTLTVKSYSGHCIGGFEQATVSAEGTVLALRAIENWLGYYIRIRNVFRDIVFFGKITQAEVNSGGLTEGKSLDEMANHLAVRYSYDDNNGNAQSGITAYADDTESQTLYGIKDLVQSQSDLDATTAVTLRDQGLAVYGKPVDTPTQIGSNEITGTLTCKGLWATNAWRIYNQPGGVEQYTETGSFEHFLGWGQASTVIGFEHTKGRIHDLGGLLTDLRTDDQIVVSGAVNGANNGTFTISEAANHAAYYYHPTTGVIFWQPSDDVFDNLSGMGFVQSYEMLYITSTPGAYAGNLGYMFAKSDVGAYHITVDQPTAPNTIVHDGPTAGQDVQIKQGHSIAVTATTLVTETPASTVTMAGLGVAVGQSFTLSVNSPFTVAEVYVRLKKVLAPTDSVYVSLQADSSGSPSNVSIETVSVLGSTLSTDTSWVKFTFGNTNTLAYGTTYWLVVGRTGSNSPSNYYVLDLNEDAGYAGGTTKLWNGSAWVARSWGTPAKGADMPFQIWGHQETSSQISDILTAKGQFFAGIDMQSTTSVYKRQFRDGDLTAKDEIETMMKLGTSAGKRLLSSVTPDRIVHVFAEPDYNQTDAPLLHDDGSLTDVSGTPLTSGKLPFGRWVTRVGLTPGATKNVNIAKRFVERCEWDAEQNKLSAVEFKGAPNPWDIVSLK